MRYASVSIARTELRRTVRAITGNRMKLVMMAVLALFLLGPVTAVGLFFLPELGAQAAAGIDADTADIVSNVITGGTAVVWLVIVFMTIMRTVTAVADVDEPSFLLVSTPVRNTVLGIIACESALYAVVLLPFTLLYAAAFAFGAGTVLPVLVTPVLISLIVVTAVPVGFAIGVWVRHLITVYEPIAQYRTLLFTAFWLVYFGAIATGQLDRVLQTLFTVLQSSPLGWPGHVLLFGIPGLVPSPLGLGGAIGGSAIVVGFAVTVAVPSARIHWFADPARPDDDEIEEETSSDRLARILSSTVSRPVRGVAVTAIRRTKRAPIRLAYAGYPLFGALGFGQVVIETRTVPSFVAVLFCLYVVWAAGVLFTLNPLGDLGPALPAVLTSTLTGRQAIRGRMLAGSLIGVPLALVVSVAFGVVSPLSLEHTAVLAVGTTAGAVATPALATGIGSTFPRFGSVKLTNNREAVMPSKTAFLVYTLAIALPTGAAVVLYLEAPELIAGLISGLAALTPLSEITVSARAITIGAWAVLIGGLIAPVVSYRYAIEGFDWYTLE
ncbi:hypothetical protein [Natrinema halophilum]|uniref:ABC-2 type transport system permease protein n=1 Tax=Natrinema halophilum TaxID=1699371 RepID=A0A7D5GTB9_9EURY|nr:hypothetical protein [Natrinema halophilum]QLG49186.1 hypothetical protein HYG82_10120 [Natrinema halophilum]